MENDTILLTRYIASWGWHLIGIIFLSKAISFFIIKNIWLFLSMIGVFLFCEIMANTRQKEMEDIETTTY